MRNNRVWRWVALLVFAVGCGDTPTGPSEQAGQTPTVAQTASESVALPTETVSGLTVTAEPRSNAVPSVYSISLSASSGRQTTVTHHLPYFTRRHGVQWTYPNQVRIRYNRRAVSCDRNLAVGSDGQYNDTCGELQWGDWGVIYSRGDGSTPSTAVSPDGYSLAHYNSNETWGQHQPWDRLQIGGSVPSYYKIDGVAEEWPGKRRLRAGEYQGRGEHRHVYLQVRILRCRDHPGMAQGGPSGANRVFLGTIRLQLGRSAP